MSSKSLDAGNELLELLGDRYVQAILAATSREPMSAQELSDELDTDVSTIYRRVDQMLEHEFLIEQTRIVGDGSHHSIYEANVNHVAIDIHAGELTIDVQVRESPSERFTRIWDDIRET